MPVKTNKPTTPHINIGLVPGRWLDATVQPPDQIGNSMPKKPTPIADQLRKAIALAEKRGITRYRIAQLSGVTERSVGLIASGARTPKIDTAEKIIKAIGGTMTIDMRR